MSNYTNLEYVLKEIAFTIQGRESYVKIQHHYLKQFKNVLNRYLISGAREWKLQGNQHFPIYSVIFQRNIAESNKNMDS